MAVKELTDKGSDGARLGQSTADLVGFWGATPVALGTVALTALTTADVGAFTTSSPVGFTSTNQAAAICGDVKAMKDMLQAYGFIPADS